MKKCYAVLTRWDGYEVMLEIKKEWADDIVCAVEAQILVRVGNFAIAGDQFSKVDIVEAQGE